MGYFHASKVLRLAFLLRKYMLCKGFYHDFSTKKASASGAFAPWPPPRGSAPGPPPGSAAPWTPELPLPPPNNLPWRRPCLESITTYWMERIWFPLLCIWKKQGCPSGSSKKSCKNVFFFHNRCTYVMWIGYQITFKIGLKGYDFLIGDLTYSGLFSMQNLCKRVWFWKSYLGKFCQGLRFLFFRILRLKIL